MLLRFTGSELIHLATRGAGLPTLVHDLQWTDTGVRAGLDLAAVEVDSLPARLALRAAGVVQIDVAVTDFDVATQLIACSVTVQARSLSMDRLLHLLQGRVNSSIATALVAQDLPADTAVLDTTDGEPVIRIAIGPAMTQLLSTSPIPAARLTSVSVTDGILQCEINLDSELQ